MLPLSLLLLTSLLLPSSKAHCPEKFSYETCHHLHQLFEQALLSSSQNLYKLREEYFPSSKPPPIYGHVGYIIHYNYSNSTPACDGNTVKSPQPPLEHSKCFPWSNSAILACIDPIFLSKLQLHLLDLLLQNAGAVAANLTDCEDQQHPDTSMHDIHLQLTLDLKDELQCVPSEDQVSTVLADLTSWVNVRHRCKFANGYLTIHNHFFDVS